MASLNKDNKGWKISFRDPHTKKQRTLRPGSSLPKKAAQEIKTRVEHLITAKASNLPLDAATALWVAGTGSDLQKKLVNLELIEAPEAKESVLLGVFLANYFNTRTDVESSTLTAWGQARRYLLEFFGEDTPIRNITPGDAEEWRLFLKASVSEVTARKRTAFVKQFFNFAVKKQYIPSNPFADLNSSNLANPDRLHFVERETAAAVIDRCPDTEWRLLFALARYGGLRVPSEPRELKWEHIHWDRDRMTVISPKTKNHPGGKSRVIPLFPEIRPYLETQFELAEPGTVYVFSESIRTHTNPGTRLKKIVTRAGETPWPRIWHNLRSTCQTELEDRFPSHVVCKWLGNSISVANKHYLQTTETHYAQALTPVSSPEKVATPVATSPSVSPPHSSSEEKEKKPQSLSQGDFMASDGLGRTVPMEDRGLEPLTLTTLPTRKLQKTENSGGNQGGNISGISDPRLLALVDVWEQLPEDVQAEILLLAHKAVYG